MREGPQSELFFGDLPKSGQAMGFNNQKENNQSAKHHQLDVRDDNARDWQMQDLSDER